MFCQTQDQIGQYAHKLGQSRAAACILNMAGGLGAAETDQGFTAYNKGTASCKEEQGLNDSTSAPSGSHCSPLATPSNVESSDTPFQRMVWMFDPLAASVTRMLLPDAPLASTTPPLAAPAAGDCLQVS